jgi:hypothetical protein
MYVDSPNQQLHRAIVTFTNPVNGEIRVKIPAVTGLAEVSISQIGRKQPWVLPDVGETIVVGADDDNMTNIFWVQTNPLRNLEPVIDGIGDYVNVVGQVFTNFTLGNGTVVSRYARIGNLVHFHGVVTLGSTSAMTGALRISLPFPTIETTNSLPSNALFFDGQAPFLYLAAVRHFSADEIMLVAVNTGSLYASFTQISSLVPFTWNTNDSFSWNHVYEAV